LFQKWSKSAQDKSPKGRVALKTEKLECGPIPNVMAALPWRRLLNAAKFG